MHWLGPYVVKEVTDGGAVQLGKLNGDPFIGKVNGSRLKLYTSRWDAQLTDRSIVLALQAVEIRCGTINESARKLHENRVLCKKHLLQESRLRIKGYATASKGGKVTIEVTIHDKMFTLR